MYQLPKLDYPLNSLEPYIDVATMKTHYIGHHQTYVDNLNATLIDNPNLQKKDIEILLKNVSSIPENIREKIINNGGGHYNHSLYWKFMSPKKTTPQGEFRSVIKEIFGSPETLSDKLSNIAISHFGSGWGWLVIDSGKLEILSTPNQISPISENKIPILGIDVWEHAYYLKYQNKRADYIKAWWNVVNWDFVSMRFNKFYKNVGG